MIVMLVSTATFAQNAARFPRIRERINHAKLEEIRRSLDLDQPTMNRFSPVYARYEAEITAVNFRDMDRLMRVNPDSLSAEEAERLIQRQLLNARKLINIREKYYYQFKTVLTPQQIIRLYQTEAEIRKKVMHEVRRRFGNPGHKDRRNQIHFDLS